MGMLHRGALCALLAGAIALASAPTARAQCTGDCGGDGHVTINELIIGVSIALGSRPPADCPPFQNASGKVDIAQLIRAVGFALGGCPPPGSPSATDTSNATATITPTATSALQTATATRTFAPIGSQHCTLIPGNSASHVEVNRAGFPVPILVPLSGSIDITCGSGGTCACRAGAFEPITITGLGKVCIAPADAPCPSLPLACAGGGSGLAVAVGGDGNIGTCADNAACAAACAASCGGSGSAVLTSGCTGFCSSGTMAACNRNSDCTPGNGVCNGADPVGARNGRCQCQCVNAAAGSAPRPGELQCALNWTFAVVDTTANCGDPPQFTAPACTVLTTSTVTALMTEVNYGTGSIPGTGVLSNTGTPLSCELLRQDDLTGLKLRGAFGAFGATPTGDALNELFFDCE